MYCMLLIALKELHIISVHMKLLLILLEATIENVGTF